MNIGAAFKAFFKALWQEEEKPQTVNDPSHLKLLRELQLKGRLIDFLQEDISSCTDQEIGAAVRKIHQDAAQVLEECVTLKPVVEKKEGDKILVPAGYDLNAIKVVGKVKGEPPYTGVVVHPGWRAVKTGLPRTIGSGSPEIIQPAEVEMR